jgi:hypothetical protein
MVKNQSLTSNTGFKEYRSHFVVRCRLDGERFVRVVSSVTSRSVLFFGVTRKDVADAAETEGSLCPIAMFKLPVPVDPDDTTAAMEGEELVVNLTKAAHTSGNHSNWLARVAKMDCQCGSTRSRIEAASGRRITYEQ